MQKTLIPSLPADIEQLGICVLFDKDIEELMAWSGSRQEDICCQYDDHGEPRWISLQVNACGNEHVHFHVEMSRRDLRDSKNDALSDFDKLLTSIDDFLEQADGIDGYVQLRGRFRIPRKEIPEHGVIGSLLSFKKKAAGAPFSLNSARLEVEHDWFTKMDFVHDDEKAEVRVQLWAIAEMELNNDYLCDLTEVMATGADCFIFERVSKEAST